MGFSLKVAWRLGLAAAAASALLCAASLFFAAGGVRAAIGPQAIAIDYPLQNSIFPPEITPPEFLWHDPEVSATRWEINVSFAGRAETMRFNAAGELMQRGTIDPQAGPGLDLTPEQASTHTWRPDAESWTKIKQLSRQAAATITIQGIGADGQTAVSTGSVTISTSTDPVGAPIFYRDVPLLLPPPGENGPIQPLPQAALPLIKWQVRNLAEPQSRVVMGNMPTCANCHSFSRDGKTFGLDLDGPRNDKGLYALVPVEKRMTIANKDVLRWSSFQVDSAATSAPSVKRFGFMSQVSPDGRYVVTSIGPPDNGNANQSKAPGFAPGILDRLYSTNYRSIEFSQVFYPTRGILAWYDARTKALRPLPGADDPRYVQTSAFWSPDGKYLIYSRALARDPYPAGAPKPEYANDPRETQIQYDLYKVPFNEGRGGKAEPVLGASDNGMSNDFPKVSPDGRWIVWVQNKNGLLMRPDSRLFMVPFAGGKPRLMNCNLQRMNSWHTFSPNGRWLAFSSKARGPYTRLMLTHIDADGNDSPAIVIDNTTAANRAANIPEFVNIAPDGLEKIDPQATEFYRIFDQAFKLMESNQIPEAIAGFRQAMERDPEDALVHYVLATALSANDQEPEALQQYRRATELDPRNATFLDHLAVSMAINGQLDGAAGPLQKAIALEPNSAEYRFNLGLVLEKRGDFTGSVAAYEKAVELSQGKNRRALSALAKAYSKAGRPADAARTAQQALDLAEQAGDGQQADQLRQALAGYRQAAAKAAGP